MIYLILVLTAFFIASPDLLINGVKKLMAQVNNTVTIDLLNKTVYDNMAPIALALSNSIIVPLLVESASVLLRFEIKSDRHRFNFYVYTVILMMTTLLFPLFGLTNFSDFMSQLVISDDLRNSYKTVSIKAMKSSEFFVTYLVSLTFFSTLMYVFDFAYLTNKFVAWAGTCGGGWKSLRPKTGKTQYYIDFGSFFAKAVIVFAIGNFFCTIAPLIPILCFFYFFVIYWIHKYNFLYLYEKEFDTFQPFGRRAANVCVFIIFLDRLFITYIMYTTFGEEFQKWAIIFLSFECLLMIVQILIDYGWICSFTKMNKN
jgi:hypothetical protein